MSQAQTDAMPGGFVASSSPKAPPEESDTMVMSLPAQARPYSRRVRRIGGVLTSSTGVWSGLGLAALGFGAIFFAWLKVAGLVNVALQMPYVVSGGLTGLALVIVGMTVVDVSVRRQDSHERRQQLAQMTRVLDQLRDYLEESERYGDQEQET